MLFTITQGFYYDTHNKHSAFLFIFLFQTFKHHHRIYHRTKTPHRNKSQSSPELNFFKPVQAPCKEFKPCSQPFKNQTPTCSVVRQSAHLSRLPGEKSQIRNSSLQKQMPCYLKARGITTTIQLSTEEHMYR